MVKKIVGLKVLILPLSVAFLLMFTVLFIKPAYDSMAAAKKSVSENSQQISSLQSQNTKLAQLKSKWEAMEEKKLVQVALPEKNDIENYMSELYGRISRSGVLLNRFETQNKNSSVAAAYACQGGVEDTVALPASVSTSTPASSGLCANSVGVSISVTGSWDQILGLFKYLEDTNRVANIRKVAIKSTNKNTQEQPPGDFLDADVTLAVFYKPMNESGSSAAIGGLAAGGQFNEDNLKKLKNTVFSLYEEPIVSEVEERNIFK